MQRLNAVLIYSTMLHIYINVQYAQSQTSELQLLLHHLSWTQYYTTMRNESMKKPQHS